MSSLMTVQGTGVHGAKCHVLSTLAGTASPLRPVCRPPFLTTSRPREATLAARDGAGHVDVLIADDDALTRRGLRLLLEQWGFRCAEAGDGREAIDLAMRQPPWCVLLDLMMPRLDGLAVARALRADPRTRAAHIHCMSGLADPLARRWAMEAGCESFFVKPVDPAELLGLLRRFYQVVACSCGASWRTRAT